MTMAFSASVPKTVAQTIDDAPIAGLQKLVFALCILIAVLDGFDTQSIGFVAPAISTAWHLSPIDFGFLFSATLLGSVVGTSVFGALSDRFGRRNLTIAMTVLFGICSGASALAGNFQALLACRLIGGIGLGGVIPNTMALATEYAPLRKRSTIVTMTLWGFPAGAVIGGLVSGPMIAALGWRSVFVAGGVAPLLLGLALLRWLPESIRFLASTAGGVDEARKLMTRIAPGQAIDWAAGGEAGAARRSGGYASLFGDGLAPTTILLSLALFCSLLLSYLLVNWTPSILAKAGMPLSSAILGVAAINAGGIAGSYLMSRLIDRSRRPLALIASGYGVSGCVLAILGAVPPTSTMALVSLGICGFFLVGTQMSMTAFTSSQFPVALRGTGIGFVQAFGRLGSLFGPMAGAAMLNAGLTSGSVFSACLVPALASGLALYTLLLIRTARPSNIGVSLEEAMQ